MKNRCIAIRFFLIVLGFGLIFSGTVCAEDWPVYQHDDARSGVAADNLPDAIGACWQYRAPHPPRPAWPEPAKRDIWHEVGELTAEVTYDRAYHPVIAEGLLYFGSSSDDQIYCLDAKTGEVRWTFFTEAPVRLAPCVAGKRVYAGSDDGNVYCLDAVKGKLLWQFAPDSHARRLPGNGRIIASTPVRTGLIVRDDRVYGFAGLFPSEGVYRFVLDAKTGKAIENEPIKDVSPQGYLLASSARLFVPTGRTSPVQYDLATGKFLGPLDTVGGAFAVVAGDWLMSGPGRRAGVVDQASPETRESVLQFDGIRVVIDGNMAYVQSKNTLSAIDHARHTELGRERHTLENRLAEIEQILKRKSPPPEEAAKLVQERKELQPRVETLSADMRKCQIWTRPVSTPYALIKAGNRLVAGGDNQVVALNSETGEPVWTGAVEGKAYGLAAASGTLYVSTDQGVMYAFGATSADGGVKPEAAKPGNAKEAVPAIQQAAEVITQSFAPQDAGQAIAKGYCLVLGADNGQLALEMVQRTSMDVIVAEPDARRVEAARQLLVRAGVYGIRAVVHQTALDALPYTSYLANVIVSERAVLRGEMPGNPVETARVLRPCGGLALIGQPADAPKKMNARTVEKWTAKGGSEWTLQSEKGVWAMMRRGAVPGAGEWTQLYANAAHTACSGDDLTGPMRLLWFGEPGPRDIIDRHHRPMSTLHKNGRLFVPADNRVIAVDAYNGARLWEREVPNSRRAGALRNCGHMVAMEDYLYVAVQGECWALDPANGEQRLTIQAPQPEGQNLDWGYVNVQDNLLIGSVMAKGASLTELHLDTINNMIENDFRPMIASRGLFAVDRHTGATVWTYTGGVIMNNGITLDGQRLFFIESRAPKALENTDGRLRVDYFCKGDTDLVALDMATGKEVWRVRYAFPYDQMFFLSNASGILLACGTYNVKLKVEYGLFGFDAASGQLRWQNTCQNGDSVGGSHGEQWQHPVIIGNRIFSDPFAFDLLTGERQDYLLERGGNGCGGLTGSDHYMYGRGANPRMYPIDVPKTNGIRLTEVSRPGCWLNIIPAGGIIAIPESSSGCTCAYPIQTSFAFLPESALGIQPAQAGS